MQKARIIDFRPFRVLSVENSSKKGDEKSIIMTLRGRASATDEMHLYPLRLTEAHQKFFKEKKVSLKDLVGKAFSFPIEERIAGLTGWVEKGKDGVEVVHTHAESSKYPTAFANYDKTMDVEYNASEQAVESVYAAAGAELSVFEKKFGIIRAQLSKVSAEEAAKLGAFMNAGKSM